MKGQEVVDEPDVSPAVARPAAQSLQILQQEHDARSAELAPANSTIEEMKRTTSNLLRLEVAFAQPSVRGETGENAKSLLRALLPAVWTRVTELEADVLAQEERILYSPWPYVKEGPK